MKKSAHTFHIPVMGSGHSVDTPIRVSPFGIDAVISLVDDYLLEKLRKHYCEQNSYPYEDIPRNAEDGRSRRVTAYLNTVKQVVNEKFEALKSLPFFGNNDKDTYFELLPDDAELKQEYNRLRNMPEGAERTKLESLLTEQLQVGSIDVNLMVKLDKAIKDKDGNQMSFEHNDAHTGLRGYANSQLESKVILSAGINQSLYNYMAEFRDFYRSTSGDIKKKIVLKVSDFRSAMIQGKYLARKGLEVSEFRIESGLNCGGHAFATNGNLLPGLLQEFMEKRDQLVEKFRPMILKYYASKGWEYPESALSESPTITVQGGIGTSGEHKRMLDGFGLDVAGWGSPFLLVEEATPVDNTTRELLRKSGPEDFYLSGASPLGVPFNNVRGSGSILDQRSKCGAGKPGAPCVNKFLISNTEYTDWPICTASHQYQKRKLKDIDEMDISKAAKDKMRMNVIEKECICFNLGNGALISLGISKEEKAPQAICPGPNLAWFTGTYTLKQMVDHIYGRTAPLTPADRPHMFIQEMKMYMELFEKQVADFDGSKKVLRTLKQFSENIEKDMDFCLEIAAKPGYPDENLESIPPAVEVYRKQLHELAAKLDVEV